jgi:hypothetical protein
MISDVIQKKIRTLRTSLKSFVAAQGIGAVIVTVGLCSIVMFLFDYLAPLPALARLVLLCLACSICALVLWRSLLVPFLRRVTDDAIAVAVELKYPQLNDRLISSIQLARTGENEGFFNSPELVGATIKETQEIVEPMRFSGVFSISNLVKTWLLCALIVVVIASFCAAEPESARIFLIRYFSPFSAPEWPRYCELEGVNIPKTIAKGDDLEVEIRSTGRRHPNTVTIYSKSSSQDYYDAALMLRYGVSSFKKVFENVNEPFKFYAVGGDARTPVYAIDVKVRPFIEEILLWFEFPSYTGMQNTPKESPVKGGTRSDVPVGSKVKFVATANNVLKRAQLKGITNLAGDNVFEGAELENGRTVRGEFVLMKSITYFFELTDVDGFDNFTNHKPVSYYLRVRPDSPPKVKIAKPGINKEMTSNATLPLEIEITDEYAIKSACLKYYKIKESEQPTAQEQTLAFKDVKFEGQKECKISYPFELEPLGAKVGESIIYYVQALDFNTFQEEPGQSQKFKISIVAPEELQRTYLERILRIKEQLGRIINVQELTMEDLNKVSEKIYQTKLYDKTVKEALLKGELDQRSITRDLGISTKDFEDVLEGITMNKLGGEFDYETLGAQKDRLKLLAEKESPEIAQEINDLRKKSSEESGVEGLFESIYKKQVSLKEVLEEIIKELGRWSDYHDVIREVTSQLEKEKGIRGDTKDVLEGSSSPKQPQQKTPEVQEGDLIELLIAKLCGSDEKESQSAKEALVVLGSKALEPLKKALQKHQTDSAKGKIEDAIARIEGKLKEKKEKAPPEGKK